MRAVIVGDRQGDLQVRDIPGDLRNLQHLVGGYIECCAPAQLRAKGIEMLADEEGLLTGKPFNANLWPFFFVGDIVLVGVSGEDFVGLTDSQVDYINEWFKGLWEENDD